MGDLPSKDNGDSPLVLSDSGTSGLCKAQSPPCCPTSMDGPDSFWSVSAMSTAAGQDEVVDDGQLHIHSTSTLNMECGETDSASPNGSCEESSSLQNMSYNCESTPIIKEVNFVNVLSNCHSHCEQQSCEDAMASDSPGEADIQACAGVTDTDTNSVLHDEPQICSPESEVDVAGNTENWEIVKSANAGIEPGLKESKSCEDVNVLDTAGEEAHNMTALCHADEVSAILPEDREGVGQETNSDQPNQNNCKVPYISQELCTENDSEDQSKKCLEKQTKPTDEQSDEQAGGVNEQDGQCCEGVVRPVDSEVGDTATQMSSDTPEGLAGEGDATKVLNSLDGSDDMAEVTCVSEETSFEQSFEKQINPEFENVPEVSQPHEAVDALVSDKTAHAACCHVAQLPVSLAAQCLDKEGEDQGLGAFDLQNTAVDTCMDGSTENDDRGPARQCNCAVLPRVTDLDESDEEASDFKKDHGAGCFLAQFQVTASTEQDPAFMNYVTEFEQESTVITAMVQELPAQPHTETLPHESGQCLETVEPSKKDLNITGNCSSDQVDSNLTLFEVRDSQAVMLTTDLDIATPCPEQEVTPKMSQDNTNDPVAIKSLSQEYEDTNNVESMEPEFRENLQDDNGNIVDVSGPDIFIMTEESKAICEDGPAGNLDEQVQTGAPDIFIMPQMHSRPDHTIIAGDAKGQVHNDNHLISQSFDETSEFPDTFHDEVSVPSRSPSSFLKRRNSSRNRKRSKSSSNQQGSVPPIPETEPKHTLQVASQALGLSPRLGRKDKKSVSDSSGSSTFLGSLFGKKQHSTSYEDLSQGTAKVVDIYQTEYFPLAKQKEKSHLFSSISSHDKAKKKSHSKKSKKWDKQKKEDKVVVAQEVRSNLDVVKLVRLGSLSKDHTRNDPRKEKEKEDKEEELSEATDVLKAFNKAGDQGAQMIQRCVIIQRDEKGYGLTVSGDNPVFVQSVKENGAAARAGVQQGDRIIKVNGSLVTNCNHLEVVKLIKSGSYVALTLLGRSPGTQGSARPHPDALPPSSLGTLSPLGSERITGPQPVNAEKDQELRTQKIATIRMMYEQIANETERLKAEYTKSPSEPLQVELQSQLGTLRTLEQQLLVLTGIPAESHLVSPGARSPPQSFNLPGPPPSSFPSHLQRHSSSEYLNKVPENPDAYESNTYPPSPNPAPWLPGGPRHRKTESMPDTMLDAHERLPGAKDVTVTRSHSDSRKESSALAASKDGAPDQAVDQAADIFQIGVATSGSSDSIHLANHSPGSSPTASPHPDESWNTLETTSGEVQDETCREATHIGSETPGSASVQPLSSSSPAVRQSALQVVSPNQVDVISMEEEFSTDEEHSPEPQRSWSPILQTLSSKPYYLQLDEPGPFSDLNVLKHRHAHLAVFLHYLISNSDPSPLLFYLVTEAYTAGNMKEMRKWAYEIHSTFLTDRAPLKVTAADEKTVLSIDSILQSKHDKEDQLRSLFQVARHMAQNEITELLADFRSKRSLGLGSLYGDHELQDDYMDRQGELRILEKYLVPHFERLVAGENESERNKAMALALATFLKQVGVTLSGKAASALERCPSFVAKDKKTFKLRPNKKVAALIEYGHHFLPAQYYIVTVCNHCQGLMWGVGHQGFQCMNCEYNIHKHCLDLLQDTCLGSKKKKDKRQSMFDKIITRKPSSNNPAAIAQAQRNSDEASSSPVSVFHIRPAPKDEDEDDLVKEAQRIQDEKEGTNLTSPTPSSTSAFYVRTPSSDKLNRLSHFDLDADVMRSNHPSYVAKMVDQFGGGNTPEGSPHSPVTPPRSNSPVVDPITDDKTKNTNLSRSESLNRKEKKESRKHVRRTRSDVRVDEQTLKALDQSGSSSNSSISASLDSPSNSNEGLYDTTSQTSSLSHRSSMYQQYDDSDLDVETELPPLEATIPKEVLKKLKPKERKRQEVINELFYTERTHVRNLKLMHRVFFLPMRRHETWLGAEFITLLFPNLDELISMHCVLNNAMKSKKKDSAVVGDIADVLLTAFDGDQGKTFRTAYAVFCRNQSLSLEALRTRQKKDQKLANWLQERSSDPTCRRLELKDLLPTVMQRLTKYRLLLENLLKYTQASTEEYDKLQKALECTKITLHHVDQEVKNCENQHKLADFQRRLDKRPIENSTHPVVVEYKNLDLRHHKMIYEGALTWRMGRNKQVDLQVVLLDDILVLLTRQDDRLVLKCHSMMMVAGKEDTKLTHSPIIKLTNLLTRNVATDKRAFFLVSTSEVGPQIYELVAISVEERKKWFNYISEAATSYRSKDHSVHTNTKVTAVAPPSSQEEELTKSEPAEKDDQLEPALPPGLEHGAAGSVDSLETFDKAEVQQVPALVQPTEVVVSNTHIETAQPILTPTETLKRQDELLRHALEEKQRIVSDILQLPHEEFENMAEMVGLVNGDKEPRELVLAAMLQANRLTSVVNDSLQLPDTTGSGTDIPVEGATAVVKESPAEAGDSTAVRHPAVAASALVSISTTLQDKLSQLLAAVTERDNERDRLAAQLKAANEQLLRLQEAMQPPSPGTSASQPSRPNSIISVTSSTSEPGDLQVTEENTENLECPVVCHQLSHAVTMETEQLETLKVEESDTYEEESDDSTDMAEEGFMDARSDADPDSASGSSAPGSEWRDAPHTESNSQTVQGASF